MPDAPLDQFTFTPKFRDVTGLTYIGPMKIPTPMNRDYFADDATAQFMMRLLGAQSIDQRPQIVPPMVVIFDDTKEVAYENWLVFRLGSRLRNADGSWFHANVQFTENAGLLAAFFERNPPKGSPDENFGSLAMKMVWAVLKDKYLFTLKG